MEKPRDTVGKTAENTGHEGDNGLGQLGGEKLDQIRYHVYKQPNKSHYDEKCEKDANNDRKEQGDSPHDRVSMGGAKEAAHCLEKDVEESRNDPNVHRRCRKAGEKINSTFAELVRLGEKHKAGMLVKVERSEWKCTPDCI